MATEAEDDWARGLTLAEKTIVMSIGRAASIALIKDLSVAMQAAGLPQARIGELAFRVAVTFSGATIFAGGRFGRDREADARDLASMARSMVTRMPDHDAVADARGVPRPG